MTRTAAFAVLLLMSGLMAADISANFRDGFDPGGTYYRFNTDMQFNTDFTLSVVSGEVASGNAADLQSGDSVCSGAVVRVTPSYTAKWATPDLDIGAAYPNCGSTECPAAMQNGGSVDENKNVKWLSTSVFNDHDSFGDVIANSFVHERSRYDQLGTFYGQPMMYRNNTGNYNGKAGEANVFCRGEIAVRDGTTAAGTITLPSSGTKDINLSTAGAHSITTRFANSACFAVAVKRPTEYTQSTAQDFFLMSYFTNNQPSVPEAVKTKTITVVAGGGAASFAHTSDGVELTSASGGELTIIRVRMRNTGDPIKIANVTSSNPSFTAVPFPVSMCDDLALPSSLCPSSNGFNEEIPSGSNRDLYVLLTRGGGASGGTSLTFGGQTTAATCGTAAIDTDTVNLEGALSCAVEPPSIKLASNTIAEFTSACYDLSGGETPCGSGDWAWNGLAGEIIDETSEYAHAYSTSPSGSHGTLDFTSGIARCASNVTIDDNNGTGHDYECEFIPPSANMRTSSSRYFKLNCFKKDAPSVPDGAEYDPVHGLGGTTSNSSTAGTTYNAPAANDSGDLRGIASWSDMPDPMVGKVVFAEIIVSDQGITGQGYECIFNPANAIMNVSSTKYFELDCYVNGTQVDPESATYDLINGLAGTTSGSTIAGTNYNSPADQTAGDLRATVNFDTDDPAGQGVIATAHISVIGLSGNGYECMFNPANVSMNISSTQHFDLNCYVNGTPTTPGNATYDLTGGLTGSLSGSSVTGTNYHSPATPTSGNLRAIVDFITADPAGHGITAIAYILVTNQSNGNNSNTTNDTNKTDDPDNPGASEYCIIGTSTLNVFPGSGGWVSILCGPSGNRTVCSEVSWNSEGGITLLNSDTHGTGYTITGGPNTGGRIKATVDGDPDHTCWLGFNIAQPECWEYS
jgi:hypothetical protein